MDAATNSIEIDVSRNLKRTRQPRLLLFSVITFTLSVGFILLGGEFIIRFLDPQELTSDVIEMDPDLDFHLRPNAQGWMTSPEYSAEIKVNSLGFRGKEMSLQKKPGVIRVLFLGASFIFGHGLHEEETLPYRVEQELNRKLPGKFEVINGGVYGYSTANDLELLKKYGLPLKPDVIIILVMTKTMEHNAQWLELNSRGELQKKARTAA